MNANLPTTPGQYWFREIGTEDWQPYYVTTLDDQNLICHCSEHNVTSRCLVSEMPAGQWAKAHKPDEGGEVYLVCDGSGRPIGVGSDVYEALQNFLQCSTSPEADFIALKNKCGYTCEPVTIYRKEKE